MRKLWGATALLLGSTSFVYTQESTVEKIHDTPEIKGSIIANLLQEHDNPFTLYPYESNYLLYTSGWDSTLFKNRTATDF